MDIFATTQDLEAFWRPLTGQDEQTRASSLLNLATAYLKQIGVNNEVDIAKKIKKSSTYRDSVKLVVLAAVKRAMLNPTDAPPADQWSQSASPYAETMKFTNPSSDLFFKTAELQLIGLSSVAGRSKFGLIRGVR